MLHKAACRYTGSLLILLGLLLTNLDCSASFQVTAKKWYLNPDGEWLTIVSGSDTTRPIHFSSTVGEILSLPVWAYNNANVVKVVTKQPTELDITARSNEPPFVQKIHIPSPSSQYAKPLQLTITAPGPCLSVLGISWLGRQTIDQYQIWRRQEHGRMKLIGVVSAAAKTFQDESVRPGTLYHYSVYATLNNISQGQAVLSIKTPSLLTQKSLTALMGKGIIIYIDPSDPASPFYYQKLPPEKIIKDALKLGFNYIQLRTAYGAYSNFNHPAVQKWLLNLLELAGKNKIAVLSWSIPRRDSTSAIAEDIKTAAIVSPSGYRFAGSSLDLESGQDYMGKLPDVKEQMENYVNVFRKAVGANYLVSAIVFTPWKTGYTNDNYPYQAIANNVDVLQPMVFWHHYFASAKHIYTEEEITNDIVGAITLTQLYAGKEIPINVIGQSIDIGNTGMPTRLEINMAMNAAMNARALGVSFFAWSEALLFDSSMSETAQGIQNFKW